MDTRSLLRAQFQQSHGFLDQVIADVPQDALDANLPGSTINSIGATYAHIVFAEDTIFNGMVKKAAPIYGAWAERVGVPPAPGPMQTPEWAASVKMNLPIFREYAKAVFEATDAMLAGFSEAELASEFDTGFIGKMPLAQFLGGIGLYHVTGHSGEIAALKGVRGLKGLPF